MISAMAVAGIIAGCAVISADRGGPDVTVVMKSSFKQNGQAGLDRLDQDDMQRLCSQYENRPVPKDVAERLEREQQGLIKYPADGKYLGSFASGERIAQSGRGRQFSDDPANPVGANCYACHELSKTEVSFGTIGPSLYNFGKIRGNTPEMQKYAYGKIYNSQAFSACSNMPRFGHKAILNEQQIRDVVALLMDPASPVNQ
jgi:sulfur-oxidizing protein SoxX